MNAWSRPARINIRVFFILVTILAVVGASLVAARQVRRQRHARAALAAGQGAFARRDWATAAKSLRVYLLYHPDDLGILRKYAEAGLAVRPLDPRMVNGVIAAYRRIARRDPLDRAVREKLVLLYAAIGQYDEIASVARARLEEDPQDGKATLWLADALVRSGRAAQAQQTLQAFLDRLDALPERQVEYVQACVRMSALAGGEGSAPAAAAAAGADPNQSTTPLTWLDRAVNYAPDSVEARVQRARLSRRTAEALGDSEETAATLWELARQDLDTADAMGTDDPQLRYFLGAEWMALGELDRASAELEAADRLPQDVLAERFLDMSDWIAAKFLLASELAVQKRTAAQSAALADEALACLSEKRHRVQVLPPAIQLYVSAGRTADARRCLDEYLRLGQTQKPFAESSTELAWLQAVVARAEGRPHAVIDALQPLLLAGNPAEGSVPWQLLTDACNQTNQPGRAVNLLLQGLRRWPQDVQMRGRLAEQYAALGDWDKAFAAATMAETVDPSNAAVKLLRIGAAVNLAAKQADRGDAQRLQQLDDELAELRRTVPEDVDVRILQAIIDESLQRPDEAERELKLAMEQCREPRKAELQLARHYQQVGRKAEAIAVCRAACEHSPNVVETWLFLAELHLANTDPNAARRCLDQGLGAVAQESGKHALSVRRALVDLTYGNRAAGIERLRALAAQDAQDTQARVLLLETREIQDDPAAAARLVAELRQAEQESGLWWRLHQAALWLSAADWRARQQDILDLLQYCRSADPAWSAPVLLQARVYEKLGDTRQVEEVYRTALLQNPAAEDIADRLFTLLEKQGRLGEAEKMLQQIDKMRPFANAWQVRIAVGAGDLSRAIDLLHLRVSNDARDALSRVQLAQLVYRQTKDAGRALEYLKEAETLVPDSRAVAAARAFILQAEGRKAEALQVLDDQVARQADFGAYWMRAAHLAQAGDLARAEADYRKLTTFPQRGAIGYQLLGGFYAGTRQPDQAVAALEEGLRGHPEDLGLQRDLMQLLFQRSGAGDRERARRLLTALEARLPQDVELTTLHALQMVREPAPQSFAEIRQKLEAAVKREPTAVQAHLALIAVATREQGYRAACDYAIRALGFNPNSPVLLAARSRAELLLGYTPMAIKLAHAALQQDPNNIEAMNVLAQGAAAGADRKLLGEVQALIDSALGRNPGNEKFLLIKAHVLASLERPQEAIPALRVYCQTEEGKGNVTALVTLADLYRLAGDAEGAGPWIEQAQRLDVGSQVVVHARCLWLMAQNRWGELANISAAYISAKDQDLILLLKAASMLAGAAPRELLPESLKLFEHTANLFPTSVDARIGWASTLYRTGDGERAKKIYREMQQRYPDNARVLNDLAWILQEQDHQYEAALELANRGLRLAPADIHLLDTRATILANLPSRLADARSDFALLAERLPAKTREKARTYLRLGRLCAKLNDPAQAQQYLQNALEIDRETPAFTADERLEITKIIRESATQAGGG